MLMVKRMTKEEREESEQEYENLEFLIKFHSIKQVIKDPVERQQIIDAILDRMNEIKNRLETE